MVPGVAGDGVEVVGSHHVAACHGVFPRGFAAEVFPRRFCRGGFSAGVFPQELPSIPIGYLIVPRRVLIFTEALGWHFLAKA